MRKILFRGKSIDTGEWVEGGYYTAFNQCEMAHFIVSPQSEKNDYNRIFEVEPRTVGEYTGLQDKNGRMIFEGDVVCRNRVKYIVRYVEDNAAFMLCDEVKSVSIIIKSAEAKMEVVGNVYDNQELLEEGT